MSELRLGSALDMAGGGAAVWDVMWGMVGDSVKPTENHFFYTLIS